MAHAYATLVPEADLAPLLLGLAADLRFLYTETATDVSWDRFAPPVRQGLVRGRAFGPACEVQFWRQGEDFRFLVVVEQALRTPFTADQELDLSGLDAEEVTFLLWGERRTGDAAWTEPGFARQWQYPVGEAVGRVGVRSIEYRDRRSGDVQFVRYCDLVTTGDAS